MQYPSQSELWKMDRIKPFSTHVNHYMPRTLGRFKQVFPLVLFPNDLIIEEHRVVFFINKGPWIREVISTMATDIASIDSSTGPFLGLIHIKSLTGGPEILIDRLYKEDVLKARSLVEGVVLASRNGERFQENNIEAERNHLITRGKIN